MSFLGFLVALWSGSIRVRLQRTHKEYSYQGGVLLSDGSRINPAHLRKDPSSKLPENRCTCLKNLHSTHSFDFICGCSTSSTLSLLARFAATQRLPMLSDVTKVLNETTFQRFVYAGNAIETVQYTSHPQVFWLLLLLSINNEIDYDDSPFPPQRSIFSRHFAFSLHFFASCSV